MTAGCRRSGPTTARAIAAGGSGSSTRSTARGRSPTGQPEFTISVALLVEGAPLLGAVLNPATGEHFEAQRDCGAQLNGAACGSATQRELTGARLLSSRTEMRRRDWPS